MHQYTEVTDLGQAALCEFPYFDYSRNMELKNAAKALAAIGHESRLTIYRLLVQAGPDGMAAGHLADAAGIPPSSLSFHLKELVHVGLLTSRQEGRFVIYEARFELMTELLAYLTENCCGGEACGPAPVSLCAPQKRTRAARSKQLT